MTKRIIKEKKFTARFSEKLWLELVKCAKEHEVSMNFLINEGVKKIIKEMKIKDK